MNNNVWRPDLKEPDTFRLQVDSSMLYFIAEGLREQMHDVRREIRQHEETCGENPTICRLRYNDLITQYGSPEAAIKATGVILFDCLNDLAELYSTVGVLAKYLYKLDYIRQFPEEVGDDPERSNWKPRAELAKIKAEDAYKREVAKTDTQNIDKGELDKLLKDDEDKSSLLGLTEQLPKVAKAPAKKVTSK